MIKEIVNKDLFPDKRTVWVFIIAAITLTCNAYLTNVQYVISLCDGLGLSSISKFLAQKCIFSENASLNRLIYWVLVLDFFYLILPMLTIKLVLRENIKSFGWHFKLEKNGIKLYLIMLAFMIPLVLYFSGTQSFQDRYPFYNIPKGTPLYPNFVIWEIFYFSQFLCLEFFFRGFLINGLKPKLGIYAIYIMTIPYCMIHFGKPMPETFAAIIAGLILGFLSFRHNSIFLGFLLHVSVALSMDFAALWQEGWFTP